MNNKNITKTEDVLGPVTKIPTRIKAFNREDGKVTEALAHLGYLTHITDLQYQDDLIEEKHEDASTSI